MDAAVSMAHQTMSETEITTLYSCKEILADGIDPILVAHSLQKYGFLTSTIYTNITEMFRNGRSRRKMSEFLISHLPVIISLQRFVNVLFGCGYSKLASKLFLTYLKYNCSSLAHVHKTTSGQRSSLHSYFRRLKRMVHDAQFENPRLALRNLANRFVEKLLDETDPIKRQLLADKCVAIMGAEIDAIAITFDNNLHKHDVFSEVKKLIPETSNTMITDIIYYGRLANAKSIVGRFDDSENMLTAARSRAYNTGPCLELVNMLYIEVYVKLWEYEKNPCQEIRQSLLVWGKLGLESLEEEVTETRDLWRRMFILRMVFCLIGLGNRANPIEGCIVDNSCKVEASQLLADIDRHWQGIETRREMFYNVARARLCELNGHIHECLIYLKRAMLLAHEGRFEEIKYIAEYDKIVSFKQTEYSGAGQGPCEDSRSFVLVGSQSNSSESLDLRSLLNPAQSVQIHKSHNSLARSTQLKETISCATIKAIANEEASTLTENTDIFELSKRLHVPRQDQNMLRLKSFSDLNSSTEQKVLMSATYDSLNSNSSFIGLHDVQYNTNRKQIGECNLDYNPDSLSRPVIEDSNCFQPSMNTMSKKMPVSGTDIKILQHKSNIDFDSLTEQKKLLTTTYDYVNISPPFVNLLDNQHYNRHEQVGENFCFSTVKSTTKPVYTSNNHVIPAAHDLKNTNGYDKHEQPEFDIEHLNSVVLFEERGEPSGCSRVSGHAVVQPKSSNSDNLNVFADDELDSLDLFGD